MTISVSLLDADLLQLGKEIEALIQSSVDRIHLDLMDGQYVPQLSFGPWICRKIHQSFPSLFLETHLMIQDPSEKFISELVDAGARSITVHADACPDLKSTLQIIRSLGVKAGVAINPLEKTQVIQPVLAFIDSVLVMSVNPGKGGQSFLASTFSKIKSLETLLKHQRSRFKVEIAVDGGIDFHKIRECKEAGADVFVVGSAFFKQGFSPDFYKEKMRLLRSALSF